MKKSLILLALTAASVLTLTGCGILSKSKCDIPTFDAAATNAGLQAVTVDESTLPSSVEDCAVYCDSGMTYQVELYDLTSTTAAENYCNDLISYVENDVSKNFSARVSMSSINYTSNSYGSGDSFYYIVRVDDTVFFAFTDSAGKDTITAFAETIGY